MVYFIALKVGITMPYYEQLYLADIVYHLCLWYLYFI